MTNTISLPETAAEYRTCWLAALVRQLDHDLTDSEYQDMLERILRDGPELARPDYERWQRRFRWVELQLERQGGLTVERIVRTVVRDLLLVDRFRN